MCSRVRGKRTFFPQLKKTHRKEMPRHNIAIHPSILQPSPIDMKIGTGLFVLRKGFKTGHNIPSFLRLFIKNCSSSLFFEGSYIKNGCNKEFVNNACKTLTVFCVPQQTKHFYSAEILFKLSICHPYTFLKTT